MYQQQIHFAFHGPSLDLGRHLEDSSISVTHSSKNVKKNKETKNLEHQIKILSTHLASILLIFEDAQGRK